VEQKLMLEGIEELAKGVDLAAYLLARGFTVKPGCTGHDGIGMEKGGESVQLFRDAGGRWTFSDEAEPPSRRRGAGDFLREKEGLPVPQALERLAQLQMMTGGPLATEYQRCRRERPSALRAAEAGWAKREASNQLADRALEVRGIPRGTFDEWRFGRLTPERAQLLDVEESGLWASRHRPSDQALVLVERRMDAVAYESCKGQQTCVYVAVGKLTPESEKRLAHALADVKGGRVVLAFGATEKGAALAGKVRSLAPMVRMEREAPAVGRWSEQVELQHRHRASVAALGQRRAIGIGV